MRGLRRDCAECGVNFEVKRRDQKFCKPGCAELNGRKRRGKYADRKERKCLNCSKPFTTGREHQKFCSRDCNVAYSGKNWRETNAIDKSICTGSVGAASEMLVAADLLLKGYHVFRSMSPACPCDLAILKGNKMLRVEVTTAYRTPSGRIQSSKTAAVKSSERHDILAYVIRTTQEIIYEPELLSD